MQINFTGKVRIAGQQRRKRRTEGHSCCVKLFFARCESARAQCIASEARCRVQTVDGSAKSGSETLVFTVIFNESRLGYWSDGLVSEK